jgi:hypothetical protein
VRLAQHNSFSDLIQTARERLFSRQMAYRRLFDLETPSGVAVMKDLARFCRAHKSTFHADPRIHGVLEGRREVWLRISQHLNLSTEDLWKLYSEGKE